MKRYFGLLVLLVMMGACKGEQSVLVENLRYCEGSVAYGNSLLISNFGSAELNPLNDEGKGYITCFDGKEVSVFIPADGTLDAPKGMAVKGDYLYIADVGKLVVYNMVNKSMEPVVVPFPEGHLFVNDVVIDENTAYISVTDSSKIFSLDITSPTMLTSEMLTEYASVPGANGLLLVGKKMFIASYPPDGFTTEYNKIYQIIDLANPVPMKYIDRLGQYDGLVMKDYKLYFSNWVNGEIGYVEMATKKVTMIDLGDVKLSGPADMSLFNDAIYVPDLPQSRVVRIELQ